jgi:hypothetical protein
VVKYEMTFPVAVSRSTLRRMAVRSSSRNVIAWKPAATVYEPMSVNRDDDNGTAMP